MVKKKPLDPYSGLRAEYREKSRNLCMHQLSDEIWEPWHRQSFKSGRRIIKFPTKGTQEEKLGFVDELLFTQLQSQNLAPANRHMLPHWRADLNKYRGWLLHRTLLQMQEINQRIRAAAIAEANVELTEKKPARISYTKSPLSPYQFPEDLPKVVDDLYSFHKHIKGTDANIARCANFKVLKKAIKPFELKYPISTTERLVAHARFLETNTPHELEVLLPRGWTVTGTTVRDDKGVEYKREGGAKLIAVLKDGTQIVQLLTEQASLAYGSPRWCTAYRRGGTYFEDYKTDLLVVMAPSGERWQLHYWTRSFMDATDSEIAVSNLYERFSDLGRVLTPYWERGDRSVSRSAYYYQSHRYNRALAAPEIDAVLQEEIREGQNGILWDLLRNTQALPRWTAAIIRHLPAILDHQGWDSRILATLANIRGLHDGVAALIPKHLRQTKDSLWRMDELLGGILRVSAWRDAATPSIPTLFGQIKGSSYGSHEVAKVIASDQEWRTAVTPLVSSLLSQNPYKADGKNMLDLVVETPEWNAYVCEHMGEIAKEASQNDPRMLLAIVEAARKIPEWQSALKPHLPEILRDHFSINLYKTVASVEDWADIVIPHIGEVLRSHQAKGDYQAAVETFYMVAERPEWHDEAKPYLNDILEYVSDHDYGRGAKSILRLAIKIPSWRETIDIKHVKQTITTELALPVPDIDTGMLLPPPLVVELMKICATIPAWAEVMTPSLRQGLNMIIEGQSFINMHWALEQVLAVPAWHEQFTSELEEFLPYIAARSPVCLLEFLELAKTNPRWKERVTEFVEAMVYAANDSPDVPDFSTGEMIGHLGTVPEWKANIPAVRPKRYQYVMDIMEGRITENTPGIMDFSDSYDPY